MDALLLTMIFVLFLWLGFFLVFAGLGLLLRRLFGSESQDLEDLLHSFWVGWALAILMLQIWHFWFPVDWRASSFLFLVGALGIVWNRQNLWSLLRKNLLKNWAFLLFFLLISVWLANRAIGSERLYDTGLYHLPAVHWIKVFPIVPGLGNLHGRLAFNSSYFLYSALLGGGPWNARSQHLSGGLLLLVLLAQIIVSAVAAFRDKRGASLHRLFLIMMFTPVLIKAFSPHVSSLSPDLPVFVLGIVISSKLLEFLENPTQTYPWKGYMVSTTIMMAALGIVIKLSFLFFALLASLVAGAATSTPKGQSEKRHNRKIVFWIIICVSLILLSWMARGVILSGYLFYPSTIGSFPVEWRIPRQAVLEEAYWIQSWARQPNVHWSEVLGNWAWFKPWAFRMLRSYEVATPIVLLLIGCFLAFCLSPLRRDKKKKQGRRWLLLLPPIASLFFWFFTAPDLRYVGASFWILGTGALILGVNTLLPRKRIWILGLSLALVCSWILWGKAPIQEELFKTKPSPLPYVSFKKFETHSGLRIYVPEKGDQCWNGPLLCTPFPKADLRLRRKGNISKGFVIGDVP